MCHALLYRQPLVTSTTSRLGARQNDGSSATENDTAAILRGQSDDTAADPKEDDLAVARAQLRARAGARGRRCSRPGRGAGGQGQVKAGCLRQEAYRCSCGILIITTTARPTDGGKMSTHVSDVCASEFRPSQSKEVSRSGLSTRVVCFPCTCTLSPRSSSCPHHSLRGAGKRNGRK